ncbi:MAG: sugar phosphate nucleotidyltransferase [Anaerolineae bacterium]|jgi:glucose-1-phosphate adenylyltransferase|nr:sugar phosphate nucleotidyltransferase [Anaerolineae bacterium]
MSVLAMILAGGEGPALTVLTALRSEAAVPFAGKYRVIDFALSNCVNSGIFNVAVLTQYQPRSLNEHIGLGRPWDLDRTAGGVRLLQPYQSAKGHTGAWQEGTADAVRFNLEIIRNVEEVLLLPGDHIYKMDYNPMLRFHRERNADVTIATIAVPAYQAHRFGMVGADQAGRVIEYAEKPKRTYNTTASMGIYVFKADVLRDWLLGRGRKDTNLGRDSLPALVKEGNVYAHRFRGYWEDAGTIQAYYEANMALLAETPALDLYDENWVIHTKSEERAGAFLGPNAQVESNLLCDGCQIEGTVIRSIISPGVRVREGAVVRDSIILTDAEICPGAVVDRAILDKRVRVEEDAVVGHGDDRTPNRAQPARLNTGLTVIGKGAVVPRGVKLGRNVLVKHHATAKDYSEKEVPSGGSV